MLATPHLLYLSYNTATPQPPPPASHSNLVQISRSVGMPSALPSDMWQVARRSGQCPAVPNPGPSPQGWSEGLSVVTTAMWPAANLIHFLLRPRVCMLCLAEIRSGCLWALCAVCEVCTKVCVCAVCAVCFLSSPCPVSELVKALKMTHPIIRFRMPILLTCAK